MRDLFEKLRAENPDNYYGEIYSKTLVPGQFGRIALVLSWIPHISRLLIEHGMPSN